MLEEAKKKAAQPPDKTDKDAGGKPREERDAEFKAKKKVWVHSIQYGEPEEAEAAIDEIFEAVQGGINPDKIKDEVDKALVARDQEKKAATAAEIPQKFFATAVKGGFADIWGESEQTQKAITEAIDKRLKNGAENTCETYETVGKEFRAKKSTTARLQVDLSGERREKKREIDNVDPARGRQPENKP